MSDQTLKTFFSPKGVVIIGASTDPAKLGYVMARNLLRSGYTGAMHYVNPKGGSLFERPLYKTIKQVPNPVDLAVILVAAPMVPETLKACGARGVKAVIIATGGFREAGPEGAAIEEECLKIARKHAMRLIGPNCIGLLDTHLPVDTTFLPPPPPAPGPVAFLSHSGAICAALTDWMRGQGMGLSRLVSLGNQVDVNETLTLTADGSQYACHHPLYRIHPGWPALHGRSTHGQPETHHCPEGWAFGCRTEGSRLVPARWPEQKLPMTPLFVKPAFCARITPRKLSIGHARWPGARCPRATAWPF